MEPAIKKNPPGWEFDPPKLEDANLFKPAEKKGWEIVAENQEEHSALGNFIGAIVLGFFAIGAAMTLIREIEKGHTKSFGEVAGIVILAGIALLLGIACLGAILNFFAALKTK